VQTTESETGASGWQISKKKDDWKEFLQAAIRGTDRRGMPKSIGKTNDGGWQKTKPLKRGKKDESQDTDHSETMKGAQGQRENKR